MQAWNLAFYVQNEMVSYLVLSLGLFINFWWHTTIFFVHLLLLITNKIGGLADLLKILLFMNISWIWLIFSIWRELLIKVLYYHQSLIITWHKFQLMLENSFLSFSDINDSIRVSTKVDNKSIVPVLISVCWFWQVTVVTESSK